MCCVVRDTHLLHTLWSVHCHRNPGHRQKHTSYPSETCYYHRGGTGCHWHTPGIQEDKLHRVESTTPLRHCKTSAATGSQSCPQVRAETPLCVSYHQDSGPRVMTQVGKKFLPPVPTVPAASSPCSPVHSRRASSA